MGVGVAVGVGVGVGDGVYVGSGVGAVVFVGSDVCTGASVGTGNGDGVSGMVVAVGTGEGSTRFTQAIADAPKNTVSRTMSDPWTHCCTCMVAKPDRCSLKPYGQRDYTLDRPAI